MIRIYNINMSLSELSFGLMCAIGKQKTVKSLSALGLLTPVSQYDKPKIVYNEGKKILSLL